MKQVDYIIVGCGLASIAFCEQLRHHNKTFIVFDDKSQKSSIVAAGLYNPVVLKRFTAVWKAKEQLAVALPMYAKIEEDLSIKIDYKLRILRRFASIEEQNMWFTASDKPALEPFLSNHLIKNSKESISAELGFGEVLNAGRIDTEVLIDKYREFLLKNHQLEERSFNYESLNIKEKSVEYKTIRAKQILFAEGFGVKQNPYFWHIPLDGNKGEILTIKAPDLKIEYAIKSSVFVIPIGDDLYKVGSTYNREDKSKEPTEKAKSEMVSKLKTFIKCDFEIVNHLTGIRPTVKDRRPLVGRHPQCQNLYVMNGLGSRGVMIAPYVADKLFQFIENKTPFDKEIDISRFN